MKNQKNFFEVSMTTSSNPAKEVSQSSRTSAFVRSWSIRTALVIGSLIFTLILLEIVARFSHLGTGGFWEPDPYYGWRNISNASGWESCYGNCSVYVTINSQGLRDREIPYTKQPGVTRILVLGDSLTAAMQVPLEDTFVKVLEARLNGEEGEGEWEVINAGVNGYGTDNELLFYRLEASKYSPDVVLLGIYLANDVYNNNYELEQKITGGNLKPYFVLDTDDQLVLMNFPVQGTDNFSVRMGTFFKRHFQLPRLVAQIFALRKNIPPALKPLVELAGGNRAMVTSRERNAHFGQRVDICTVEYAPVIEEAWAITKALIMQMRLEVEKTGAEFLVFAIPASPQLSPPAEGDDWYCEQPNQELKNFLEEEGIRFLDLLEPFRQHVLQDGPSLYFQRDFHMNEYGHLLAAQLLEEFIIATIK